ncbi:MAG TPA: VOC family protein [Caulobacteraceae bacterium]|jgi:catechol 2,3-dioxygenase-like lactoylglutathione lyase family enzyme|nr:VOC family protein [Caulobacteraceae bacterium]
MITGIDHATIATDDLDATSEFFVEAVGLEVGYRPPFGVPGVWLYAAGRPILHLVGREAGVPVRGIIDHFSFATDDLDAALDRLDRRGVRYEKADFPDGKGAQAFCRDPNGVLIEITWRP